MRAQSLASVAIGSLSLVTVAHAQTEPPVANDVFVELIGSAPIVSVNYERQVAPHLGLRLGVGYLSGTGFTGNDFYRVQIPVVLSTTLGSGAKRLELGAGVVPGILTTSGSGHRVETPATVVMGYRYCPPEGGFIFRASFTPLIDTWDSTWSGLRFIPLVGVSFGYAF